MDTDDFITRFNYTSPKQTSKPAFARLSLKPIKTKRFTSQDQHVSVTRLHNNNNSNNNNNKNNNNNNNNKNKSSENNNNNNRSNQTNVLLPSLTENRRTNSEDHLMLSDGSEKKVLKRKQHLPRKRLSTKELSILFSNLRLNGSDDVVRKQREKCRPGWLT